MAVYRNCEFDFSNDSIYTNHGWDKNLSHDDILRLFGNDYSVSIYTGEITAVSTTDYKALLHDISTFKGCSGAIIFLLDKNQDGLVEEQDHGKAIGIHAGAFDETTTSTTDGSQSSVAKFNFASAIAGFAEHDEYKSSPPSPQEGDE